MKAAFFDFDGTLRPGDSILDYLKYGLKKKKLSPKEVLSIPWAALLYLMKIIPVEAFKARLLRFERRMTPDAREAFARAFVSDRLMPTLYPEGIKTWETFREAGYLMVIASASTINYMVYLAEALRADGLICTEMDGNGIKANCRREEKARRVLEWANHRRVPLRECVSWGNSRDDLNMLALTGRCTVINPGRKMLRIARQKGYPVQIWHSL